MCNTYGIFQLILGSWRKGAFESSNWQRERKTKEGKYDWMLTWLLFLKIKKINPSISISDILCFFRNQRIGD